MLAPELSYVVASIAPGDRAAGQAPILSGPFPDEGTADIWAKRFCGGQEYVVQPLFSPEAHAAEVFGIE